MMPEGCLDFIWVRLEHLCRSIQVLYKPKQHSHEHKAVICQLQALRKLWWFQNSGDCFKKHSQLRRCSCLSFTQKHLSVGIPLIYTLAVFLFKHDNHKFCLFSSNSNTRATDCFVLPQHPARKAQKARRFAGKSHVSALLKALASPGMLLSNFSADAVCSICRTWSRRAFLCPGSVLLAFPLHHTEHLDWQPWSQIHNLIQSRSVAADW